METGEDKRQRKMRIGLGRELGGPVADTDKLKY